MNLRDLGVRHLCDSCKMEFAECDSKEFVLGCDLDSNISEFEADMVIQCSSYKSLK
jgi:hypothetical protein